MMFNLYIFVMIKLLQKNLAHEEGVGASLLTRLISLRKFEKAHKLRFMAY
jgi:hypothetical protein